MSFYSTILISLHFFIKCILFVNCFLDFAQLYICVFLHFIQFKMIILHSLSGKS